MKIGVAPTWNRNKKAGLIYIAPLDYSIEQKHYSSGSRKSLHTQYGS